MYALCVSGAVNTQGFVWKFFIRAIYKFSFIHVLVLERERETQTRKRVISKDCSLGPFRLI